MSDYALELSPDALSHVEGVIDWWRAELQSTPRRFLEELHVVLRQLQRSPHIGKMYEKPGVRPMRRILLNRSGYHVYYWPDAIERVIRVYAVWYGGRGSGPLE